MSDTENNAQRFLKKKGYCDILVDNEHYLSDMMTEYEEEIKSNIFEKLVKLSKEVR